MSEIYPLFDILSFILLPALVLVDLLTHYSVYPIYWSLYTVYIHTIYCFTSHSKVLCIFLCSFYAVLLHCFTLSPPRLHFTLLIFHIHCQNTVTKLLLRDGRFCGFGLVVVRHTTHCFFVIGKLHVIWLKHCTEEAYWNRWAKRQLNNKK